ncbi:MAG: hypothetical protein E3J72_13545 [Planctomycetota bacterium]|nr:MAG: hypothetical protein E3J72_13545 [Planctomycetota bacterium]
MKQGWKKAIFGDAKNKAVALIFALIIWVVVYGSITESDTFEARVLVTMRVDGRLATNLSAEADPPKVKVVLRAPVVVLEKLRYEAIKFRCVINDPRVGTHPVALSEGDIENLLSGVRVVDISPDQIQVHVTRQKTKKMRVKTNIQSNPAEGFELRGHTITPSEIDITGPQEIIKLHGDIETAPIELQDRRESFSADFDIVLMLDGIAVQGRRQVRIDFDIAEQNATWPVKLPLHVMTLGDYAYDVKIEDKPGVVENGIVTIMLQGPRRLQLDKKLIGKIRAFVVLSPEGKPDSMVYGKSLNVRVFIPPPYDRDLSVPHPPTIWLKIFSKKKEK